MSSSLFVLIDGIQGESTEKDHHGWIEAVAYTHSIVVPVITSGGGGGSGAGHPQETFTITKHVDSTTPRLYQTCSTGKHLKAVTVDFTRLVDNVPFRYMQALLQDVLLSGITSSGDADTPPTERLSFAYTNISWTASQGIAAGSAFSPVATQAVFKDLKVP